MLCPNISNKEAINGFNEIVLAFGGKPMSKDEFMNKDLRNKRTGIDNKAMQIAYDVWNLNGGNPMDKAPNSNDSDLFSALLTHYNGSIGISVKVKANTLSEGFKMASTGILRDKNGEPLYSEIYERQNAISLPKNELYLAKESMTNRYNPSVREAFFMTDHDIKLAIKDDHIVGDSSMLLSRLMSNNNVDPENTELASLLMQLPCSIKIELTRPINNGQGYIDMSYYLGVISISEKSLLNQSNQFSSSLMHELLHHYLTYALYHPSEYPEGKVINDIAKDAVERYRKNYYPGALDYDANLYGLTNAEEFLNEFMTNKKFRDLLKEDQLSSKFGYKGNLFLKIIAGICNAIISVSNKYHIIKSTIEYNRLHSKIIDVIELVNNNGVKYNDGNDSLNKVSTNDRTDERESTRRIRITEDIRKEHGLTNGTIFLNSNFKKPMFEGYDKDDELKLLILKPNGLVNANISILVGEPGAKYNEKFIPLDEKTWDEAAIYVLIVNGDKKWKVSLKTISGALNKYKGGEINLNDINGLRTLRNNILSIYKNNGSNSIIKVSSFRRSDGEIDVLRNADGEAIMRSLDMIEGLHLPDDPFLYNSDGIKFAYGKGVAGGGGTSNDIVDLLSNDRLPGSSQSAGSLYIYPRLSDTPSGKHLIPIRIEPLSYKRDPSLADALYDSLIIGKANNELFNLKELPFRHSISNAIVTNLLVNEGVNTLMPEDKDTIRGSFLQYLVNKLLYYDDKNDTYVIGNKTYTRDYLLTDEGKLFFKLYAIDNFHINTDAIGLSKRLSESLSVIRDIMKTYGLDKLEITKSLVFDKEDMGLVSKDGQVSSIDNYDSVDNGLFKNVSRAEGLFLVLWMVKHGLLYSDLSDAMFKNNYMYIEDVKYSGLSEEDSKPTIIEELTLDLLELILNKVSETSKKFDEETINSSKIIILKINDGIKTRIKALLSNGTTSLRAIDSLERELHDLIDLEDRSDDRSAVIEFVKHVGSVLIGPAKAVNTAFEELKSGNKFDIGNGYTSSFGLRNDQLDRLKTEILDFYRPVIDEIRAKLLVPGYFDIEIDGNKLSEDNNSFIKTLIGLISEVFNNIEDKYSRLLSTRFAEILSKDGKEAGSNTIENYINDYKNQLTLDLNFYLTFIGSIKTSNEEALSLIYHKVTNIRNEVEAKTATSASNYLPLYKQVSRANRNLLYETDENGKKTGYFIRRLNYGLFYNDMSKLYDKIGKLAPIEDDEELKLWNKAKNDFMSEFAERRFTPEYYELHNNLSYIARHAKDKYLRLIDNIYLKCTDEQGNINISKLDLQDKYLLEKLYLDRKMLSNEYNPDGTLKEGVDLLIAKDLLDFNSKINGKFKYKSNIDKFDLARKAAGVEMTYELYLGVFKRLTDLSKFKPEDLEWWRTNTRIKYSDKFYDKLSKLPKLFFGNEYEELKNKRSKILKYYKNDVYNEINTFLMDDRTKELISLIDDRISEIRKAKKIAKDNSAILFDDIATSIASNYYKAELNKANLINVHNPGYLKDFLSKAFLNNYQLHSYYTKLIPVDPNDFEILPSDLFTEISPESEFYNPKYDHSNRSYYQPTEYVKVKKGDKWVYTNKKSKYDNSTTFNKAMSDENTKKLYDQSIALMRESNSKLKFLSNPDDYLMPLATGNLLNFMSSKDGVLKGVCNYLKDSFMIKDDDIEFNTNSVKPDGSKLNTIPVHFIKRLDDPSTISKNMAGLVMEYYLMAENYNLKSNHLPEISLLLQLLNNREVVKTSSKKNALSNTITGAGMGAIAGATIGSIIPGVGTAAGAGVGAMLSGAISGIQTIYTNKKGKETNMSKRLELFLDMHYFGNKHTRLAIGGLDITKPLIALKGYATFVNLVWNVNSMLAGLLGGLHLHMLEASSSVYYGIPEMISAFKESVYNLPKMIANIGNYTHNNKMLASLYVNQIGMNNDEKFRNLNYNQLGRALAKHWAWGGWTLCDVLFKTLIVASLYKSFKLVDGKFMNLSQFRLVHYLVDKKSSWDETTKMWRKLSAPCLWDMLEAKNNSLVIKDEYSQYAKYYDQHFINLFRNLSSYIAQRADGMTDDLDKSAILANVFASFIGMHRQYLPLMIDDRIAKKQLYNYMTESTDEGMYRSGMRRVGEILNYWFLNAKYLNHIANRDYMKSKGIKLRRLEYYEKANLRRINRDLSLLSVYFGISLLLRSKWDDKDDTYHRWLLYMLERARYELTNMYNPVDVYNTFKTISPAYSVIDNMNDFGTSVINGTYDNEVNLGAYKGLTKAERYMIKATPIKHIVELKDPNSKLKYLDNQLH